MKTCNHKARRDENSTYCHSCYMAEYRKKNRDQIRANSRKSYKERNTRDPVLEKEKRKKYMLSFKYGISLQEYAELLEKFNFSCAICGSTEYLCVDHDHETGFVRGILCHPCNAALGKFGDNALGIKKVLDYLNTSRLQIEGGD